MTELEEIAIEYEKLNTTKARIAQTQLAELTKILSQSLAKNADQELTIARLTAGSESMQRDAAQNTITIKMLMAQLAELKAPIEDIKYYVGNPSSWEHYDDGVSEKIRAILKAAGMA